MAFQKHFQVGYKMQNFDVNIQLKNEKLYGNLSIPDNARGIILFVHGSGSSRFSTRNRYVAAHLNTNGLATLLFDLLTEEEEYVDRQTSQFRFDISLLANRLSQTTDWVKSHAELKNFKIGYFGASTGAAAALISATHHVENIHAIVSRGGRPDLAEKFLKHVRAPTLLIVGSLDPEVIHLNQLAKNQMSQSMLTKLVIVEGATHLFEEPGKLDEVVVLASNWFSQYFDENSPTLSKPNGD